MPGPRRFLALLMVLAVSDSLQKPPLTFSRSESARSASMSSRRRVSVRMRRMGAAVLPVRFHSSAVRSPEQLEEQEEALVSTSVPPLFDPTTIGLLGGLAAVVLVLNVPSQIDMLMQGGTAVLESLSSIGAGCAPPQP